jgi:3'-5' exoribonuclease
MKNCFVSDLGEGSRIDDVFLVNSKSLAESRNGSMYIRLQLSDRSGVIDAFKWDASEDIYERLSSDEFVQVRGAVRSYNGKLQIDVDTFRSCSCKVDPADFLPRCERDIDEMLAEMREVMGSVRHPQLKAILDYFFKNQEFLTKFATAPAALKIHHAYIGGLLEHSLCVSQMCQDVAARYKELDHDILITGALIHDIGKVEEFSWDAAIKYSDSGHFLGHIVAGTMMLDKAINAIPGFDPMLKLIMEHMVVSHHGQKEWGSPKRPKSLESIVLHFVEDMDAKINTVKQALGKTAKDSGHWTERNWVFDRPLFRGLPQGNGAAPPFSGTLDSLLEDPDPFADD